MIGVGGEGKGEITIAPDPQQLAEIERLLDGIPKAMPGVLSRALNRAIDSVQSRVSHAAAKGLALPLREVKRRIRRRWSKPTHLLAMLRIKDWGFSLALYKPRKVKGKPGKRTRGRSVKGRWIPGARAAGTPGGLRITKGPAAGFHPGAFTAFIRKAAKDPGVYRRVGKPRFPVTALRTEGVVAMIEQAGGWAEEGAKAQEDFDRRMRVETEKILAGGKWTAVRSAMTETWSEWRSRMGAEEFR